MSQAVDSTREPRSHRDDPEASHIQPESQSPPRSPKSGGRSVKFSHNAATIVSGSSAGLNKNSVEAESSADETTALAPGRTSKRANYGTGLDNPGDDESDGRDVSKNGGANGLSIFRRRNRNGKDKAKEPTWWGKTRQKYQTVELENKGSVARDHLALERTFLAWLRTSLGFASIGIAITQLFRLNTTIAGAPPDEPRRGFLHLRQIGKPLGATFIGVSIVVLFVGFQRYFEAQHWIIRGKFPASRGSVAFIAALAAGLIVVSLVLIIVVNPRNFDRK